MAFVDEDLSIKERFSLLLLDPGEIYFEDFSVYFYPTGLKSISEEEATRRRCRGRLKICSKSIVFDPQDVSQPIMKFPLRSCIKIEEWSPPLLSKIGSKRDTLFIQTPQTIQMKAGNEIGPYNFKKGDSQYFFTLNFGTAEDVVHPANQLARAATLPMADQDAMIATIVYSRQKRVKFDTSRLESLYETIVVEMVGERITPLVVNPGRIMVTSTILYFQPFNNVEPVPVMKIKLSDIKRLVKRRFLLKHVGLEVFCDDSIRSNLFLVLSKPEERDELYAKVVEQPGVRLQESGQENMMLLWQNKVISNFDYLMYLNSQADRSINDITQYPVFPWILADYTSLELDLSDPLTFRDLSKPIGAINTKRLERFRERRKDMPEPKFLYGSHYSTPGYVLYYLVRVAPEEALCLQNGRFDQPDRLFKSAAETWNNVLSLPSDVKELIPEFYQPEMSDFLINRKGLKLGTCQDGSTVTNVVLPPWADDEADFCRKCRQALESDYVSHHLHHWIDLIFGYKQKGPEAEAADNVFYYLTYEGAIDLDSISDPNEKASMQSQIMEFGQTPKQLFTKPHPTRFSAPNPVAAVGSTEQEATQRSNQSFIGKVETSPRPELPSSSSSSASAGPVQDQPEGAPCSWVNDSSVLPPHSIQDSGHLENSEPSLSQISPRSPWERITQLQPSFSYKLHKDSVCDLKLSSNNNTVFSVSKDTQLKMYSLEDQRQLRSVSLSNMALSSVIITPDDKNALIASWDNSIYVYSVDYGRVLEVIPAHDDAVSALCWQQGSSIFASASWDSTVKLWAGEGLNGGGQRIVADVLTELDHDSGVTCTELSQDGSLLLTGTKDGDVNLWNVEHQVALRHFQSHHGPVNVVIFSPDCQQMASAGQDSYIRVIDVNTGTEVFAKDGEHEMR
ncbi:protein FAN-like [Strongylocentrotus purpuratus]|uniref:Protein FAN n=1 Tax=Strongylocentrotus purpuratus TaxID=7668 RepID=A0A7M7N6A9_STRPU|nr:protein FAN-like [Strongylocentrotus purpuratus]